MYESKLIFIDKKLININYSKKMKQKVQSCSLLENSLKIFLRDLLKKIEWN